MTDSSGKETGFDRAGAVQPPTRGQGPDLWERHSFQPID